jgi:hypothetical protein
VAARMNTFAKQKSALSQRERRDFTRAIVRGGVLPGDYSFRG